MSDVNQMTKLEKTIVAIAEDLLWELECFIQSSDSEESANTILRLSSLLMLAHLDDSGMSQEACTELLKVEDQYHSQFLDPVMSLRSELPEPSSKNSLP